jgi:hypothetical protein
MPPDRTLTAGLVALLAMAVAGCGSMESWRSRSHPPPVQAPAESHEAKIVSEYLAALSGLVAAAPAEQAETLARARQAATLEASPKARLMYALMLSLPGHGGSDLSAGRKALLEIIATPERLLPQERSLAGIMMATLEARSSTDAENRRLHSQIDRQDRDKASALNRRIQALVDDNERLKKELDDANAKLDAIATLERSMSDRRPGNEGKKP